MQRHFALLMVLAITTTALSQETSPKKPWELSLDERIQARFGAAERSRRISMRGADVIEGRTDPGLFFPTELFDSFVRSVYVAPSGDRMRQYITSFGGDGNGVVDRRDSIWGRLRLWIDRNHDGQSETHEVSTLGAEKILELSLERKQTHIVDEHGNALMLLGSFTKRALDAGMKPITVQRQLVDIAFVPVLE